MIAPNFELQRDGYCGIKVLRYLEGAFARRRKIADGLEGCLNCAFGSSYHNSRATD